jgi:CrcB protein
MKYTLIAAGAGLGGVARYLVGAWLPLPFPWATLVVNATGGALIGYLALRLTGDSRWLWVTGFCGGYTTFSTFSLEVIQLLEQGRIGMACAYVVASSLVCVAAAGLTYWGFRSA